VPRRHCSPGLLSMTLARRFLAMAALMVWQGGFLFYTAAVVPTGTEVLGSPLEQGFITRQVTTKMNICGAIALVLMSWDLAAARTEFRLGNRLRWLLFASMVAAAVGLYLLHDHLEGLLDVESHGIVDRKAFHPLHRAYLWVSSVQWGCAMIYLLLTLAAWRQEDGGLWRGDEVA
jgi:hypothetical protein